MKYSYIYILTNEWNTTLYIGVCSDLLKRVYQHKHKTTKGFTQKYNVNKLVYYEQYQEIEEAILREKQLKSGSRKKKVILIENVNPEWEDLYKKIL